MALNTQIEQMNTQTPAHANEFNKRFNQLSNNDKYLNKNKVDKVSGKGLSDENYSTAEKQKLVNIEAGANKYVHPSSHPASMVTGLHALATSGDYNDLKNKPDLSNKVDKISGKGLSTEDFTTELRRKLGGIDYNANNYTHPDTHLARMITCDDGKSVELHLDDMKMDAGDKTRLKTKDKTNLVNAVDELFQYANDIKNKWNNVLGTDLNSTNSSEEYKNHTQWCKNKLVGNLGEKRVFANSNESLSGLVDKVSSINIGGVKSIQRIIYSGNQNKTINISPVDLKKSIILTHTVDNDNAAIFENDHTITIKCESSIHDCPDTIFQIIEFNSVKSIQRGIQPLGEGQDTFNVSIQNVDMSKSLVLCNNISKTSSNSLYRAFAEAVLINNNTIQIKQEGTYNINEFYAKYAYWQIIEFN